MFEFLHVQQLAQQRPIPDAAGVGLTIQRHLELPHDRDVTKKPSIATPRSEANEVTQYLKDKEVQVVSEAAAKLFGQQPGSSAAHTTIDTPKTKRNNKGDEVTPGSPDCGLSPTNPGRDGTRKSRRLDLTFSPEKKVEPVD